MINSSPSHLSDFADPKEERERTTLLAGKQQRWLNCGSATSVERGAAEKRYRLLEPRRGVCLRNRDCTAGVQEYCRFRRR